MPIEQAEGADRAKVTHLEAVGRLLNGIAPWLEATGLSGAEARIRRPRFRTLAQNGLAHRPRSVVPDALNFTSESQPLVDAAFLGQAVLRAPRTLRDGLDDVHATRLVEALTSTRQISPGFNNWLLFSAMVEAALKALGASWDRMRVDYAIRQHEQWYKGDGAVRRRPRVSLGLLQQLRDSADAAGRARCVRRRLDGVARPGAADARTRAPVRRDSRAAGGARRQLSRRSDDRSRIAAARFICSRSSRCGANCPRGCRRRRRAEP